MPRRLFIDTGALIALEDADDMNHERAVDFARRIRSGEFSPLYSSSYILAELMAWFSRYPDKKIELGEKLRTGTIRLVWVDRKVEQTAWEYFCKYKHHPYSLTDCVSFIIMDRHKIRDVFAFDEDFLRPGRYRIHPGLN